MHQHDTAYYPLEPLMAVAISYVNRIASPAAVRLRGLAVCDLLLQRYCPAVKSRLKPLNTVSTERATSGTKTGVDTDLGSAYRAGTMLFSSLSERLCDADDTVQLKSAELLHSLLHLIPHPSENVTTTRSVTSTTSGDNADQVTTLQHQQQQQKQQQQPLFSLRGVLQTVILHLSAVPSLTSDLASALELILRSAAVLDTTGNLK